MHEFSEQTNQLCTTGALPGSFCTHQGAGKHSGTQALFAGEAPWIKHGMMEWFGLEGPLKPLREFMGQ